MGTSQQLLPDDIATILILFATIGLIYITIFDWILREHKKHR